MTGCQLSARTLDEAFPRVSRKRKVKDTDGRIYDMEMDKAFQMSDLPFFTQGVNVTMMMSLTFREY
jgi:hypothetical protein